MNTPSDNHPDNKNQDLVVVTATTSQIPDQRTAHEKLLDATIDESDSDV